MRLAESSRIEMSDMRLISSRNDLSDRRLISSRVEESVEMNSNKSKKLRRNFEETEKREEDNQNDNSIMSRSDIVLINNSSMKDNPNVDQ
jgi:hypothetical protein